MEDRLKKYIEYICGMAVILFLLIKIFFDFINKDIALTDAIAYTTTATSFIALVYISFLWKYNPFEKIPKIYGEYKGILVSNYDNIERNIDVIIHQNLFEIRILLNSNESSSKSITANIYTEYGTQMLSFGYINNPKALKKDTSPIHYGMCILEIKNKNTLEGQYFTDRHTLGDIKLQNIKLEENNEKKIRIK